MLQIKKKCETLSEVHGKKAKATEVKSINNNCHYKYDGNL